jgi:hypothetical protein
VFSATNDEAAHVGAGLELIEHHRYTFHPNNPPPPAVVMAAVPWLSGMRLQEGGSFGERLHSVFYGHGKYEANLVRARAGNLLFFVLAAVGIWLAAPAATLAVLVFTLEPVVLGHSGLATYDIAATAGVALSLAAFVRYLRKPSRARGVMLGVAWGASIVFKFSGIVYVPLACAAMFLVRLVHDSELRSRIRAFVRPLPAALAATAIVIWAGYGFTIAPFVRSVMRMKAIDQAGFLSYLCGETRVHGWWWYFPFAIILKTTLAAVIAFVAGAWFAMRDAQWRWPFLEWSAAAVAIVAFATTSSLDIGVRYVLPFYAPFAIAIACGLRSMLQKARWPRWVAAMLVVAHAGASAASHPDYFPYFNVLAGNDPSRYLIDSNLDWGQDVLRLRRVIRNERIDRIGMVLMGPADYDALGFPPRFEVNKDARGWIAVSDHAYRLGPMPDGTPWPDGHYRRIGKSIRLYHLP